MNRYDWGNLNRQQLGRYAEYFVKMEFTMFGFDIYTSEVDDKGIDFVARKSADHYYEIQVKSVYKSQYIFLRKNVFDPRPSLMAAVVTFRDNEAPNIYLIQSLKWLTPNTLLVSRDYPEGKSEPEWGLNLSRRNQEILSAHTFDQVVGTL